MIFISDCIFVYSGVYFSMYIYTWGFPLDQNTAVKHLIILLNVNVYDRMLNSMLFLDVVYCDCVLNRAILHKILYNIFTIVISSRIVVILFLGWFGLCLVVNVHLVLFSDYLGVYPFLSRRVCPMYRVCLFVVNIISLNRGDGLFK